MSEAGPGFSETAQTRVMRVCGWEKSEDSHIGFTYRSGGSWASGSRRFPPAVMTRRVGERQGASRETPRRCEFAARQVGLFIEDGEGLSMI